MYLDNVIIKNNGIIKSLNIQLEFTQDGNPKPLILAGLNGSGKTNFLSIITDALLEGASEYYNDMLPSEGVKRLFFRKVGSNNITQGEKGSYSFLKFTENDKNLFFAEKAGLIDIERNKIPAEYYDYIPWQEEGSYKRFNIDKLTSRSIFGKGIYVSFPSNRFETPYWLNETAIPTPDFDTKEKFHGELYRPIYVEKSLELFCQWLRGLVVDVLGERQSLAYDKPLLQKDPYNINASLNNLPNTKIFNICRMLMGAILQDKSVGFTWMGRKEINKFYLTNSNGILLKSLSGLSTGQSTLLGIFGTLIRYGDLLNNNFDPKDLCGICIIDEIDSHVHTNLQYGVIPNLMKIFPKIQFIVSSHSPIFILGMEKEFGRDGIKIINMPEGNTISSDEYEEFKTTFQIITRNSSLEILLDKIANDTKPMVIVEGETDEPYLKKAAQILCPEILEQCDIEWIGTKIKDKQSINTGKDALKGLLTLLKSKPFFTNKPILLLYDNDQNPKEENFSTICVRKIPKNKKNDIIENGIENLLPKKWFIDKYYDTKVHDKKNGTITTIKSLSKKTLCEDVCKSNDKEDFVDFTDTLNIIKDFLSENGIKISLI